MSAKEVLIVSGCLCGCLLYLVGAIFMAIESKSAKKRALFRAPIREASGKNFKPSFLVAWVKETNDTYKRERDRRYGNKSNVHSKQ